MPAPREPWWNDRLLHDFVPDILDPEAASQEGLAIARRHRVELALLDRLAAAGRSTATLDDYRTALAHQARLRRLRAVQVVIEVTAVIDHPVLVVKGPAAAHRWYDRPDHRPFGDVDLLVRRSDLASTVRALEEQGGEVLLENWRGFLRHGVGELPVRWGDVVIDLHWDLVALSVDRRSLQFDVDAMIERSVPLALPGGQARTLDDVDTLLHHCTNTGLGGARLWGQLLDIGLIAERADIDIDSLTSRARASGVGALCAATLQRSRTLIDAPIPTDWIDQLEPWRGWTITNRLVDGMSRHRPSHGSVAPGFWLASGRCDTRSTCNAATRELTKSWHRWRKRPSAVDLGGDLNWLTPSPTADADRSSYLHWVEHGKGLHATRTADIRRLDAALGPLEPRSTPALGLAMRVSRRGDGFVVTVEHRDGSIAAVIAVDCWHPLRRTAFPVVLEPVAARTVAEQIDLLAITEIAGFDVDLDLLRPLVRRWGPVTPATPVALPYGAAWESPSPSTRVARPDDLDRITDLMWRHAGHGFARRSQLKRNLRDAIDDLVVVVETDGVVTGLAARESATPRYHFWSTMVVEPGARGSGQSWELIAAIVAQAFAAGAGAVGHVVSSNPMPAPHDALVSGTWQYVRLAFPSRWPGERRLRRYAATVERRLQPAPNPQLSSFRRPGADDDRITDRRTQTWWSGRTADADTQ